MEMYLCITQINDFIFCPRSIYFHNIYKQSFTKDVYHKTWQKKGLAAHKTIDEGRYSSKKDVLQGMTVFCQKYNLVGKIDTFEIDTGLLVERKYSVTALYDGFKYQLYAQLFALEEMGYNVKHMKIYSKKDNKNYPVALPTKGEILAFEKVVDDIGKFSLDEEFTQNIHKCRKCIYNMLCDVYKGDE
jgi:CRISPR-associated exonuclease Cas4